MIDANGTKFHLLLSRDDWSKCTSARSGETLEDSWNWQNAGEIPGESEFDWSFERNEIGLQARIFQFKAAPKDDKPNLKNRRGAGRDRYGNWFWIDETGEQIKVLSVGSKRVSTFYPNAENACEPARANGFQPIEKAVQSSVQMRGLAVTVDHFLVVGTLQPAGLLVFDLFAASAPRRIEWRADIAFAPFDIAARRNGGAFVLDRANRRYWTLDRNFNPVGAKRETESLAAADDFQPLFDEPTRRRNQNFDADDLFADLPPTADPISIEALPDDSVLILNRAEAEDFSIIERWYLGQKLDDLSTDVIKTKIKTENESTAPPPEKFRLRGYDIAFVAANEERKTLDRLYVVGEEGNQAFAFNLICVNDLRLSPPTDLPKSVAAKNFELLPVAEYFPMRLFGGKGFTAASDGAVYYDCGERFLPLVRQNRPGFALNGALESPVFDGKEANCVWHRLMLDGCIPPETRVEVFSRYAEQIADLPLAPWQKEPNLYLRGSGSELPFAPNVTAKEKGKGTWELLFQRAAQRYLQLRLEFTGDGRRTPRISALRVYYPRFSYLDNYLPSIYREDEASAFFLDRFLANFEGVYTTIEERIAGAQMLFDARTAPGEALDWLANWFGVALDPAWSDDKRRLFISRAVEFFQYRGTRRGLQIALRLALDSCADERIFDAQTAAERVRDPIRIVERFLTRRTPAIIPADAFGANGASDLPRILPKTARWNPHQGADVLHERYGENFDEETRRRFPLLKPDDAREAVIWERFALEVLSFVPSSAAASERRGWQNFLRGEYRNNIADLNDAHGARYRETIDGDEFEQIFLPNGAEMSGVLQNDWQNYLAQTDGVSRNRRLWQDFLARRYRRINSLNDFYGTRWQSFESIALFDRLPTANKPLVDWFAFESGVLPMHRTAHRFTVLIPATLNGKRIATAAEQARRLELARRVVELEKPAHTVCDFRYYWNLFRIGEARLGADTLLGLGSRDPLLNPAFVAGQSFVGEARVGIAQPEKFSSRYVLGSEALPQKKKKDGEL